jgi:hypothetical protein
MIATSIKPPTIFRKVVVKSFVAPVNGADLRFRTEFARMSRKKWRFAPTEVKRAIKLVLQAGLPVSEASIEADGATAFTRLTAP